MVHSEPDLHPARQVSVRSLAALHRPASAERAGAVALDAARYRWLRDQGCTFYVDDEVTDMNSDWKSTKHHVCLWAMDQAIDNAMKESPDETHD